MSQSSGSGAVMVVRYDGATLERAVGEEFDALLHALLRPSWRAAVGEVWLEGVQKARAAVLDRLRQPFQVLVVGDFKRGKSTLINALIGADIVVTDVAPETVAITELHHGPVLRVEARLVDGGLVELSPNDLPSERLSTILANLPAPLDVLRVYAPLPALEGVVVVDSPGMGDQLWRFDERVQTYLPRADAVIHVVSAISPLSASEREFLRVCLQPLDLAKVMFVVNQIDLLRDGADEGRVVARIRESLRPLFPDSEVFPLSALAEVAHRRSEPALGRAEAHHACFSDFREFLDRRVLLHREVVRTERAVFDAVSILRRAAHELSSMRSALDLDRSDLARQLTEVRSADSKAHLEGEARIQRVHARITALGEQACEWMDEFVTRVEVEAFPQISSLPHADVQRHFPFFLAELLRDAMASCMAAHQREIVELANVDGGGAGVDSLADAAGAHAKAAADRLSFHPPGWTVLDHVQTVSFMLGQFTFGLSSLIGTLATSLTQRTASDRRAEAFRAAVWNHIPELRREVGTAVRRAYAELATRAIERLASVQAEQEATLAARLAQALAVHDRGAHELAFAQSTLGEVEVRVNAGAAKLDTLRQRLRTVAEA